MRWQRLSTWFSLLLVWTVLAVWQYQEYRRQADADREKLREEADLLMNVLIPGIRYYQGRGALFEDQLQDTLDVLAGSEDILAVAIASEDGQRLLSSGEAELFGNSPLPVDTGQSWEETGLWVINRFQLTRPSGRPVGEQGIVGAGAGARAGGAARGTLMARGQQAVASGRGGMSAGVPGEIAGRGAGRGRGATAGVPGRGSIGDTGDQPAMGMGGAAIRGYQRGRGAAGDPAPPLPLPEQPPSAFSTGGRFSAILILDDSQIDAQRRSAAWLRSSVVGAGGLVLVFLALAWRSSIRLAEAQGQSRLLQSETRHLRELSQAAAGLAHETRNPLGLIRGWSQQLAQLGLDSPQQQQADAVVEECDRVTARINQFLAFAKPCEPKLEPVRVASVISELAVLLEPDLAARNLTLNRRAVITNETILADREMLRQALFNLIQNAVEASPEGGTIVIFAGRGEEGEKRIEVADAGPGVSANVVESLFTPYFTTRAHGTGLGLAIVRRIALAHGWQAGYAARSGGGAVFWLGGIHD